MLQNNNPHQNNITTMVGYPPPQFPGAPGDDPEDFINDLKRYVLASQINVAPGAGQAGGRAEVDSLFETCLVGDAKIWYINEIKDQNYQLDNILDNTEVANITAFRALNNGGLTGINANQFRGEALRLRNNAGGDNTITGVNIIPAGVWDED